MYSRLLTMRVNIPSFLFAAKFAQFAIYPLKWQAGSRGETAESSQMAGGWLG